MAEPISTIGRQVSQGPRGRSENGDYLQNAIRLGLLLPLMELMDLCSYEYNRPRPSFSIVC
jgi:hypothetical protein